MNLKSLFGQKSGKASAGESFGSFLGAVILILSIRWLFIEPYVIPSGSMIPSLLVHDHILVNKISYGVRLPFSKTWIWRFSAPERGEVIVFRSVDDSGYFMIKRVIGLPGEEVSINDKGEVAINGEPISVKDLTEDPEAQGDYYQVNTADLQGPFSNFDFQEAQLENMTHRFMNTRGAFRFGDQSFKVPEGHYFMMGDNRDNSRDSRYWESLPEENILGRATYIWLTCEETLSFLPFLCNPMKLRWKRMLHRIR